MRGLLFRAVGSSWASDLGFQCVGLEGIKGLEFWSSKFRAGCRFEATDDALLRAEPGL